jgi:2-methylcitrate dehydratase PrpD
MMLLDGEIDPRKFPNKSAPSPDVKKLADLFEIVLNDVTDPNALGPQSLSIIMNDGTEYAADCADPYGSPGNPMQREAREQKVRRCFEVGNYENNPAKLIKVIENIMDMSDVRELFSTVCD